ncbi:MAG: hypothetical protein C0392_16210, partial [Syntrophus sp. (in: bacteria)]|nr:hypothetical protein [Syntrophus sp. (in: bacteria)]
KAERKYALGIIILQSSSRCRVMAWIVGLPLPSFTPAARRMPFSVCFPARLTAVPVMASVKD